MDADTSREIVERLVRIEEGQKYIKETQEGIQESIKNLPCPKHQDKIEDLQLAIPNVKLWVLLSGLSGIMGLLAIGTSLLAFAKAAH